jgi:hypothetical protein
LAVLAPSLERQRVGAVEGPFLAARNDNPQRYVWEAKGEDILRKIDAARQALAALQSASNALSETAH